YFQLQEAIALSLDDVYAVDLDRSSTSQRNDYLYIVGEYRNACSRIASEPWRQAEARIKTSIHPGLKKLTDRFDGPFTLMKKREKKLLDYDRVRAMRANGDRVDKPLAESADAYLSLNAQLTEELPHFLDLVAKAIDVLVAAIAEIQSQVYGAIHAQLDPLLAMLLEGRGPGELTGDVRADYEKAVGVGSRVDVETRGVGLLWRWRELVYPYDAYAMPDPSLSADLDRRPTTRISPAPSYDHLPRVIPSPPDTDWRGSPTHNPPLPARVSLRGLLRSAIAGFAPFPPAPPPSAAGRETSINAVAIYPFRAETHDELTLAAGDRVHIVMVGGREGDPSEDWWFGVVAGKGGWFPGTFAQEIG
ncbi:hypothetical protein BDK51DRAFT_32863, partial [Blyttiomyces helicus]